jgi:hypothetical protein
MRFFISVVLFFLFFLVFSYIAYKLANNMMAWINKLWRDARSSVKGYVMKVQQEKKIARSIDELPVYMQQGMHRLSVVKQCSVSLPERWRLLLRPVIAKADEIGSVVLENPKYGEAIRRFFTVTLDAFEAFVEALLKDHTVMGRIEEEKAMQSIEVFRKDFLAYDTVLSAKRRFDFQVLTDVIRHRLRK